nr:MAG TPA: hypothetical protein [Caudoviricetes sp.]
MFQKELLQKKTVGQGRRRWPWSLRCRRHGRVRPI